MMRLVSIFLVCLLPCLCNSQEHADSLESKLQDTYGLKRLEILHELIQYHTWSDPRKATRFGKQAQVLAKDIFKADNALIPPNKIYLHPLTSILAGKAYYARGQYLDAQETFQEAKQLAQEVGYEQGIQEADEYLAKIDSIARQEGIKESFLKSAFRNLNLGEKTASSTTDFNISANLKLAKYYEKNGNYQKAIEHNEKAINYLRNKGDAGSINELHVKLGELHEKDGNYQVALGFFQMAIRDSRKIGDSATIDSARQKMQVLATKISRTGELEAAGAIASDPQLNSSTQKLPPDLGSSSAKPATRKALEPIKEQLSGPQQQETEDLRKLAQEFEQRQDYQKSLEYYKLYNELTEKVRQEEQQQELALLENLYQIEQREIQITNLKQQQDIQEFELEEQKKFRNNLIIGALLLLSLAFALYLLYSGKRKDHKKLQNAYGNLEATQGRLVEAEKRIKTLLNQQVSGAIANELLSAGDEEKKIEKKFVCVMFLDIRGFTPFAEQRTPEEIINYQNDVFGFMIEIITRHHGIINQFLGDGFMATFGAPIATGQDCDNAFRAASEIVEAVKMKSDSQQIPPTKVGIGLHAGHVVAGNVGTEERKQYSITGNAVIVAARIEQLTKEFDSSLLISEEVYEHLERPNGLGTDFQEVVVKGRSKPVRILKVA